MCLIKFLVIGLLVALMGLFFYSMPVRLTLTKYIKVTRKLPSCMGKRVSFKRNCVKRCVFGFGARGIQQFGFINGVEEGFPANQGLRIGLG